MSSRNPVDPIILFSGYSRCEDDSSFANCSCVLIKGPYHNIIVDTMSPWDGDRLQQALKQQGLNCDDIQYVICTHGHPDHVGCNYLFQKAMHIVGFCVGKKDQYWDWLADGKEYVINEFVKVIQTPGHTLQDVTVLLKGASGLYAITGDLFEKEADLDDEAIWLEAGSDNPDLQRENRNLILGMADFIVPGHGDLFKVPERFKKTN